jgi:hypothetical protein
MGGEEGAQEAKRQNDAAAEKKDHKLCVYYKDVNIGEILGSQWEIITL